MIVYEGKGSEIQIKQEPKGKDKKRTRFSKFNYPEKEIHDNEQQQDRDYSITGSKRSPYIKLTEI
ncbi:hypothetical protein JXI42_14390 [bacterium]|nr:hypothetical protein [bacterium]